jgi:hypothetical protein
MGERRSFYVKFDDQECMWIDVPDPEVRIEYTWMETAGLDGREVFAESSQVIHPLLIMRFDSQIFIRKKKSGLHPRRDAR